MAKSIIKVLGLGPGDFGLITLKTWDILQNARHLRLRTTIHPTVGELKKRGIEFISYDDFYENAVDFASLYDRIAHDLVAAAREIGEIVYAVPGSPLVAESTVGLLRTLAPLQGVDLQIYPGMSFLEILYAKLGFDPITGVTIADAVNLPHFDTWDVPLIITQVYNHRVASELKLQLMDYLPDESEIIYLHNLSLADESIRRLKLYELDRQNDIDHLTSLFVPLATRSIYGEAR